MSEDQPKPAQEPIFNVPAVVTVIAGLIVAVHVIRQYVGEDWDSYLIGAFSFIPARYDGLAEQIPGGQPAMAWSFVTHMFLHGDAAHVMFNLAWLLAFGGGIAKRIGTLRFLAFYALCGTAGAALFLLLNQGLMAPVVGASGAIAGMMAGVLRYLFSALDDGGVRQLAHDPRSIRLMPLGEALTDRRILMATGVWLLMNVAAVFGIGTGPTSGPIAWEAHIGGFLFGLLCFGLFDLAPAASKSPETSQPSHH